MVGRVCKMIFTPFWTWWFGYGCISFNGRACLSLWIRAVIVSISWQSVGWDYWFGSICVDISCTEECFFLEWLKWISSSLMFLKKRIGTQHYHLLIESEFWRIISSIGLYRLICLLVCGPFHRYYRERGNCFDQLVSLCMDGYFLAVSVLDDSFIIPSVSSPLCFIPLFLFFTGKISHRHNNTVPRFSPSQLFCLSSKPLFTNFCVLEKYIYNSKTRNQNRL